ncbi:histidine phosphatase family protein [bacterium]|nr:histidine phosphatase family protein [bacterium]
MSFLEIRRHSLRGPGDHLSQSGVNFAREIGSNIGPFHVVITSHLTRAIETAVAMGFAVNESNQDLAMLPSDVLAEANWQGGYPEFARAMAQPGASQKFGEQLHSMLQSLMQKIPNSEQALIISHGGLIEAATVACVGPSKFDTWNFSASYCEGARLSFQEGCFQEATPLRIS